MAGVGGSRRGGGGGGGVARGGAAGGAGARAGGGRARRDGGAPGGGGGGHPVRGRDDSSQSEPEARASVRAHADPRDSRLRLEDRPVLQRGRVELPRRVSLAH